MNIATQNIAVVCVIILLVNTAVYSASCIQNVVITDSEDNLEYGIGFYSQGIIYITSILGSAVTSFLHNAIGVKATYGVGVGLYGTIYIAIALLQEWAIYLTSVLTGLGMGMVWVIGPRIIYASSTKEKLLRNFSFYELFHTAAMFIGSMFDYFYIEDLTRIGNKHRIGIYSVCTIITAIAAIIAVVFIKDPPGYVANHSTLQGHMTSLHQSQHSTVERRDCEVAKEHSRCHVLKQMMKKPEFWSLAVFGVYCGFVTSYIWLTFTTCVGATFSQRKIIALSGIVCGLCEMVGSLVWERVAAKSQTICTIILGILASLAYIISYIMFPGDAPYNPTPVKSSYVEPNVTLVLIIAGLLGLSEVGFAVRINTCTGFVFSTNEDFGYAFVNIVWCSTAGILSLLAPWIDLQVFCVFVEVFLLLTVIFELTLLNKLYDSPHVEVVGATAGDRSDVITKTNAEIDANKTAV